MLELRIVAIPTTVVEAVRETMRSPRYGFPAHTEVATGHGPCRHCLGTFSVGVDRRILFTYDRFADVESLPLPGPVFVHADACQRYPEDGPFPEMLRTHALTLNAYGRGRRLMAEDHATDGNLEPVVERLFDRSGVDYVQVSDTPAGCYDFRIERR